MKQPVHGQTAAAAVGGGASTSAWRLRSLVMICGAVLMSLEIIGSRIISPYFGNSIYVWGSLISIFLGALSLGYYVGGRVADKRPSLRLLGLFIAVAGITMLTLRYISPWVCTTVWETHLGPKFGTLIACVILFFIPSVLLGIVSPFSVRLAALTVSGVGKTAGMLYALSTLGSIFGTLITSFVLIDTMGTNTVVLWLGIVLIATAIVAADLVPRPGKVSAPVVVSIVMVPASIYFPPSQHIGIIGKGEVIKYETDSPYQHILVSEGTRNGRLRRNLQFDRYIESAIYVPQEGEPDDSIQAATGYTDLMHLPLVFNPELKSMLQIGGGGGTVPREYYYHYGFRNSKPVEDFFVQIVEIDPKVVEVAQQWFHLTPNDRLKVTVEDGRMFLKLTQQKYDVILVDAFTGGGQIPFHLTTKEFFTEVKAHLSPNGVLAMNVINALDGRDGRLYRSVLRTWREVGFGQIYVFPKCETFEDQILYNMKRNIILVATMSTERLGKWDIKDAATGLFMDGKVRVKDFVQHAGRYLPGEETRDLNDVPVLTDNYAPVELMAAE